MRYTLSIKFLKAFAYLAVFILLSSMTILLSFLLVKGLPTLNLHLFFGNTDPLAAILGQKPVWDGIWPALVGTFCLICLTILLALLPGIGCGLYLAEYAGAKRKAWATSLVDTLAGTPSIVMGFFGFLLILYLRRTFFPNANTCLFLASACLALLVLPVIITTTREALEAVPTQLRITAASLGLNKAQYLKHFALPTASQGIWGGIVLAIGRAAEDTAVIMLTGVVANAGLPAGLSSKFEALPFTIFFISAEYQNQAQLQTGFGAALILLLIAATTLFMAQLIEKKYKQRWLGTRS